MGLFSSFKRAVAVASSGNRAQVNPPVSSALSGGPHQGVIPRASQSPVEKQLLLVGAPAAHFQSVADELTRIEPGWAGQVVEQMEPARAILAAEHFAVLILSEGTAADPLLPATLPLLPNSAIRILLGDGSDSQVVARARDLNMQLLPSTIAAAALVENIKRLELVRDWMANAAMKKLLAQCRKLPVMSKLYSVVSNELNSPNGSIELVAHHVAKDPLMTAKVLHVINSACFGLGRQINDPCEAVMYLGMGRTRALILAAETFSQFDDVGGPGFSPEEIWNHSLEVGSIAQILTLEETGNPKLGEAAFISGLMHDMGKLILAANVPSMCVAVEQLQQRKQISRHDAELQVLGTTHAELAACLLGNWALPLPVLEAVAWHDCPSHSNDTTFTPLTAVHAANIFAYEISGAARGTAERFDHNYLLQVGLGDRRNAWRETCGLPIKQDEDVEYKHVRLRHEAKIN
jgi:HD-like signal output (HDOD) protein